MPTQTKPITLVFCGNEEEFRKYKFTDQGARQKCVYVGSLEDALEAEKYLNYKVVLYGTWSDHDREYQLAMRRMKDTSDARHRIKKPSSYT